MTGEHGTAIGAGLLVLLVYALGFHFHQIHVVMAGFAAVIFGLFPLWIVDDNESNFSKEDTDERKS